MLLFRTASRVLLGDVDGDAQRTRVLQTALHVEAAEAWMPDVAHICCKRMSEKCVGASTRTTSRTECPMHHTRMVGSCNGSYPWYMLEDPISF